MVLKYFPKTYPNQRKTPNFNSRTEKSLQLIILMMDGNLEKSHTIPIYNKRKRGTNKEGEYEDMPRNEIIP
jgi:hypothetical protein